MGGGEENRAPDVDQLAFTLLMFVEMTGKSGQISSPDPAIETKIGDSDRRDQDPLISLRSGTGFLKTCCHPLG
jgi:hypothetical protein